MYLLKSIIRKSQMSLFDWKPEKHEEQRTVHATTRHLQSGAVVQVKEHQRRTEVVDEPVHPVFGSYTSAKQYVDNKKRVNRKYMQSEEYQRLYPHLKELYQKDRDAEKQQLAEYHRQGKYPDGRMVPKEGDKVFTAAAGMFGMSGSIQGEVYQAKSGLRVKVTKVNSMFGESVGKKDFALTPDWTVQNDPELAKRAKTREEAEQAAEAKRRKERQEWRSKQAAEYQQAINRGELPVKASEVKEGDILNYYDGIGPGKKIEVRKVEEWNGGVYVSVSDPGPLDADGYLPGDFSTTLNLPDFDGGEMPRVTRDSKFQIPAMEVPKRKTEATEQTPQWAQNGKAQSYRVDFPDSPKKNHHIIASYQPKPGGWDYHYKLEERYTKDGKQQKIVHLTGKHAFESEARNMLLKEVHKKTQSINTAKKIPSWHQNADLRRSFAHPVSLIKSRKLDGRINFNGLDISIETGRSRCREWKNPHDGTQGMSRMRIPYGYIKNTLGVDGDHYDVFVGPDHSAPNVYIVTTMKAPDFTEVDEQKAFLGVNSPEEAKAHFMHSYNDPRFFGSMAEMPFDEFKAKVLATKDSPALL